MMPSRRPSRTLCAILVFLFCSLYPVAARAGVTTLVAALAETAPPAIITVPKADADGAYTVRWAASATAEATYVLQEAADPSFTSGARTFSPTTALRKGITGRGRGRTYYYRVMAKKTGYADSDWMTGSNGCAIPGASTVKPPASLSVPEAAADGAYQVAWGMSATAGATYVLEEATSPAFASGLRVAYIGKAQVAAITGRAQDTTYYYRVRAVRAGLKDSAQKTGSNGCAVPGAGQVQLPASISVPVSDPDGNYTITWGATATSEDGVNYVLEEASNAIFTAGGKTAYAGSALGTTLSGRARDRTYYYRVRATKAGWRDSGYRSGSKGCAVPGKTGVGTPASITAPSGDADGSYTVSWGRSSTSGANYVLEEATSPDFSDGRKIVYYGPSLRDAVTGRIQGDTYYYRVKAVKPGLRDSGLKAAARGCMITPLELEPYAYRAYLQRGGPLETVFTMDKPKGWEVDIAGMCSSLAFLIHDPAEPLRQIFYFGEIYPVYVDPAQKALDQHMCSFYPPPCLISWVDAPVVNPLSVENFFSHWPQIADMQNATSFMASFPPLDGIEIISTLPQQPMMGNGETTLVRGVLHDGAALDPRAGQGQFMASVVADLFGGKAGGYIVFGATAPTREFKASVGRMVESLNSFTMTNVYYNWCVAQQQQTWGAVAQAGQTLREASDLILEGWQSRTAAQDIMAYRYDDGLRGVEKLWDPATANVYEFADGFYDQYSLNRSAYNISTLEPMPDGRVDLWEGTILNGPSYVY